eukprot:scaffold1796_cov60-Cyclotella_meneghiniana.AAC.6
MPISRQFFFTSSHKTNIRTNNKEASHFPHNSNQTKQSPGDEPAERTAAAIVSVSRKKEKMDVFGVIHVLLMWDVICWTMDVEWECTKP